ncbi:MAG: multiheme c-type cytochrome [Desulfobacterales bacterium]|nr:multiheme c-type cytochrome [Desulfobacterales bacterium]
MKHQTAAVLSFVLFLTCYTVAAAGAPPVSEATQECLDCHAVFHPGIVADWEKSRHAQTTPSEAMKVDGLSRKISSDKIPEEYTSHAVGCAECHGLNEKSHKDTFEHNGYQLHVVVTPLDCALCHTTEAMEYSENLMAHAHHILASNDTYEMLEKSMTGSPKVGGGSLEFSNPDERTKAETCYYCHGTKIEVTGLETRETDAGEQTFPVMTGWPNQGVGRINPDESKGACTPCHTRHRFSMEMARKPYTCKQCHTGPDVPAYKVYAASKHGNIFASHEKGWDFTTTPWTVGKDFTAPTCAACHISLLANTDGEPIAQRSHRMNDRLPWRLFGLIYAHPHPIDPDTFKIRNQEGLQLPTSLDGENVSEALIDKTIQNQRRDALQRICLSCHDASWVNGHWERLENAIEQTNRATQTATRIMKSIWNDSLAKGPENGGSPFDEFIETKWSDIWLFYANTIRFSAAMGGGGDYSVFANGYYQLSSAIKEMHDWHQNRTELRNLATMCRRWGLSGNRQPSSAWHDAVQ